MKTLNNIFDKIDTAFRLVVIFLFGAMLLGFASCSDADADEADEDDTELNEGKKTMAKTKQLLPEGITPTPEGYAVSLLKVEYTKDGGSRYVQSGDTIYIDRPEELTPLFAEMVEFLSTSTKLDHENTEFWYKDAAYTWADKRSDGHVEYIHSRHDLALFTVYANVDRTQIYVTCKPGDGRGMAQVIMSWDTPDVTDPSTWTLAEHDRVFSTRH